VIYDISPPLSSDLPVWPGDTPLSREVLCDMAKGDNITLSTLRATVHLGAHADAPSHYGKDSATMEKRSLDLYLGPCEVVHLSCESGGLIEPSRKRSTIHACSSRREPIHSICLSEKTSQP
jgi:arylformamidase